MVARPKAEPGQPKDGPETPAAGRAQHEENDQQRNPQRSMDGVQIGSGQDDTDSQLNTSLDEVLDMLAREVERLQAALEFYRLSEHPQKDELIRWHVREIDVRQDRLEDIKALVLARSGTNVH